jgi:hypothetical protein
MEVLSLFCFYFGWLCLMAFDFRYIINSLKFLYSQGSQSKDLPMVLSSKTYFGRSILVLCGHGIYLGSVKFKEISYNRYVRLQLLNDPSYGTPTDKPGFIVSFFLL